MLGALRTVFFFLHPAPILDIGGMGAFLAQIFWKKGILFAYTP